MHDDPWHSLELLGLPLAGQYRVSEVGATASFQSPMLYAIGADGLCRLLIQIDEQMPFVPDRRSAGVHVLRRILDDDAGRRAYVDVVCRKPALRRLFLHLCSEIIQEVGQSPGHPVAASRRVLSRWRELLDRESSTLLTLPALGGIYAELRQLLRFSHHSMEAFTWWVGPLGAVHDFRRGTKALEVKASLIREGRLFEIHGVDQLQPPDGGVLHLAAMKLSVDETGQTISELLDEVVVAGADRLEVLTKLARIGYDSRDAEVYDDVRFLVREERMYLVDSKFPAIKRASFVGGDLPAGVERLSYTVNLGGEPPHPLDESAAALVFLHFGGVAPA